MTGARKQRAMSLVQMRLDVRALCDKHYRPMVLVDLYMVVGSDRFVVTAYACEEEGCPRPYKIQSGYYSIVEGRIRPNDQVRNLVPEGGAADVHSCVRSPRQRSDMEARSTGLRLEAR